MEREERISKIAEMYMRSCTTAEIARECGTTAGVVGNEIRKMHIAGTLPYIKGSKRTAIEDRLPVIEQCIHEASGNIAEASRIAAHMTGYCAETVTVFVSYAFAGSLFSRETAELVNSYRRMHSAGKPRAGAKACEAKGLKGLISKIMARWQM